MFLTDVHVTYPYKYLTRWGFHTSLHTYLQSTSQETAQRWDKVIMIPPWRYYNDFSIEILQTD